MDVKLIPVILSGGTGARLWPISREAHPKPFITLPDGENLLQKTFARAAAFQHAREILTITNKEYYLKSKAAYEAAASSKAAPQRYLLEPFARNTAPAIALAALHIQEKFGSDAVMLILPADHLITPVPAFTAACQHAFALAAQGEMVTFGIKPTTAETGYGYIECGAAITEHQANRVARFIEKPPLAAAQQYLASDQFLWNSGMFCFTAGTILTEFAEHAPALLQAAKNCWQLSQPSPRDAAAINIDEHSFAQMENISIDYAVMEKSSNITVVRCDFDWRDIGSWEAYKKLFSADQQGNTTFGDVIMIDSENNFIHSENRMVASIGISNLAIIDTPDAVLITHRDRAQDVRQVVQTLKSREHESYLNHRTVIRPWGSYTVLEEGPAFKIKRIMVKPGASLSLQKHHQRSEHWVVVDGTAEIIIGDQQHFLQTNESTFVPMNTPHRLSNPGEVPLIIIEVQTGAYLGEDDIVRLEDSYGRV